VCVCVYTHTHTMFSLAFDRAISTIAEIPFDSKHGFPPRQTRNRVFPEDSFPCLSSVLKFSLSRPKSTTTNLKISHTRRLGWYGELAEKWWTKENDVWSFYLRLLLVYLEFYTYNRNLNLMDLRSFRRKISFISFIMFPLHSSLIPLKSISRYAFLARRAGATSCMSNCYVEITEVTS